jgi:hypothetical protein
LRENQTVHPDAFRLLALAGLSTRTSHLSTELFQFRIGYARMTVGKRSGDGSVSPLFTRGE